MPNRILKDSICTSDNVDELTAFQETFFYRLIVNCDDYGRMDARAKILSARLFPLKNLDEDQIKDALHALVNADLIILYEVDGRHYLQMKTWERHQQVRARKSKYPSPDEGVCKQMGADGSNCLQMISDDSKCPRNPIQSESNPNPNRNTREDATDADAFRIQEEHDQILNAAENAGFPRNNAVRAMLIDAYAQNGKEKVLRGIEECAKHSAASIAYLQAVLSGKSKPDTGQGKPAKTVVAQQYSQRDYSGATESVEDVLARMEQAQRATG